VESRKKERLKGKSVGSGPKVTERTAVAVLAEWCNAIIEAEKLDLGAAAVETYFSEGTGYPDLVIYKSRRSKQILCVGEAKKPGVTVDAGNVKDDARRKATWEKAPYFVTTNFNDLWWYDTAKVNANKPESDQLIQHYELSDISDLGLLRNTEYAEPTKRALRDFLIKLHQVNKGEARVPKLSIDVFLIDKLRTRVNNLAFMYKGIIKDRFKTEPEFRKKLKEWFVNQGWPFRQDEDEDYDVVARQTALLLVNKMLFYYALQAKRPELAPLVIPDGLRTGGMLRKQLEIYFEEVLRTIDYETIYTTDFIDSVAFDHNNRDVVNEAFYISEMFKRHDFSKIGYDIVGRIFESLIPVAERHKYGQYFTRSDVVDLILRFCLPRDEKALVLDPACGAGTFLVRAYRHKKMLNQRLAHKDILSTLWGVDIAKFPAHLATINLAIADLSVQENYPRILEKDFFHEDLVGKRWLPQALRKVLVNTLANTDEEVGFPLAFDAIVGNPPYTRQEEMGQLKGGAEYKEKLIRTALSPANGVRLNDSPISKRAGIHAYFFIHGTKFLKQGGAFGFIVSNSWLDVDWGKGLQEFFLNNYKIIAIIESKVERWFEEADINTCIVILSKCSGADKEQERMDNLVRFVYLKKPLSHFIPPVGIQHGEEATRETWKQEKERMDAIDKLIETILYHNKYYENEELRIYPVSQRELWDEAFDKSEAKFVGAKWGKYLRAPKIFFTILEKGKGKLVPLKEIAEVRFGIKTGANEFFYLTEEQIREFGIEREFWMHPLKGGEKPPVENAVWKDEKGKYFKDSQYAERYSLDEVLQDDGTVWWVPNYVIKSPRECKSIIVDPRDLKYRVLMIHKDKKELRGTRMLDYIKRGERQGFHRRPTCASRERWYDLGWRVPAPTNISYLIYDAAHCIVGRFWVSDDFQEVHTTDEVAPYLASSLSWFFQNLTGRAPFGGGLLKIQTYEFEMLPVLLTPKGKVHELRIAFSRLVSKAVGTVFSELGVSTDGRLELSRIRPDRRELDKIIMGDILGLTEEEQLEVYRAVVDLVKSRLARAASVPNKNKRKRGLDIDARVSGLLNRLRCETLGALYKREVLALERVKTRKLPKAEGQVEISGPTVFNEWIVKTGRNRKTCASEAEARYLRLWIELGAESVAVPEDEEKLKEIVPKLEELKDELERFLEEETESFSDREREAVAHRFWQEITRVP